MFRIEVLGLRFKDRASRSFRKSFFGINKSSKKVLEVAAHELMSVLELTAHIYR